MVPLLRGADIEQRIQAKNVPKGILELLEVIRTDLERLSSLSRDHAGFFADHTIRDSVQGLHEQVLCLLLIHSSLNRHFCSDLEAALRACEAKYLGKSSLVKKMLRSGDVDREIGRAHV